MFRIQVYKSCTVIDNLLNGTYAKQGGKQNKPAGTSNTGMFLKSAPSEPPLGGGTLGPGPRIPSQQQTWPSLLSKAEESSHSNAGAEGFCSSELSACAQEDAQWADMVSRAFSSPCSFH